MRRLSIALSVLLLLILARDGSASTATTSVQLTTNSWTNVGTGPLLLSSNNQIYYAIGDVTPTVSIMQGFPVPSNAAVTVNTNSQVWAVSANGFPALAFVAPVVAPSGGSGTFTWPGSAGNGNPGATTTGTMPYVNAYIVNGGTGGGGGAVTAVPGAYAAGSLVDVAAAATPMGGGSFPSGGGTTNSALAGIYNQMVSLVAAAQGPVYFAPNTPSQSVALENSRIAKAAAGTLYGFYCVGIQGGSAGNCIALDRTTVPAQGTLTGVIDVCSYDSTKGCFFTGLPMGELTSNGIVVVISSNASPFIYTTGVNTGFIKVYFK